MGIYLLLICPLLRHYKHLNNILILQIFFSSNYNKMTMKRSSSKQVNIKKKLPKLDTKDDTVDYTKSLTSENVEEIESDYEEKLDDSKKPEKIKAAKKVEVIKKKGPKTEKENNLSKKTKGKPNASNGLYKNVLNML